MYFRVVNDDRRQIAGRERLSAMLKEMIKRRRTFDDASSDEIARI